MLSAPLMSQPSDVSPLVDESKNMSEEESSNSSKIPAIVAVGLSAVVLGISAGIGIATETWLSAVIAYGVNWLVFAVYAWPFHSEKFYDFTGMLSFLSVDIFAFIYYKDTFSNVRSIVTFVMPLLWTLRLGMCN